MKFFNKKEQVMDFKLTSYGQYLLSNGNFKPVYYTFYDDNVLYDGKYAHISESSNTVYDRVKNNTQYMQTQTLFEEVENSVQKIIKVGSLSYYAGDVEPIAQDPRKDTFHFEHPIGDAYLEGDTNVAPAWKVVLLQGEISSSATKDVLNNFDIPQINITANYRKKVAKASNFYNDAVADLNTDAFEEQIRGAIKTATFEDGNVIFLQRPELVIYAEEVNTMLLMENYDIEVFEILTASSPAACPTCDKQDTFSRKYFINEMKKVENGFLTEEMANPTLYGSAYQQTYATINEQTSSVGYYFNMYKDQEIDASLACRSAQIFNKQSYYIDLDFDCDNLDDQGLGIVPDIYGKVTESELC
tara:strand:+ start:107 stop:1180 length:1074 start_codon:yes stop_codon:yes gene_type:complete